MTERAEAAVPQPRTAPQPAPEVASISYRRALLPLDGSPTAEAIIPQFVVKIARPLDLELVLLQVIEPLPAEALEAAPGLATDESERGRREAESYLSAVASDLTVTGLRVESIVRFGAAPQQIVDTAREKGADLIAMTTHGRSGIGRLLFGSVAEAVLQMSHVPLFLLRVTEVDAPG